MKDKILTISKAKARRLILNAQGLDGSWKPPKGTKGALQTIERLGYVQIDTISVVQRAHHHIFWTRCPDYSPPMLHTMLHDDRSVFEYWTHAASYIPMSNYRYYIHRMKRIAKDGHRWFKGNDLKKIMKAVLKRITKEGPLRSADFKDDRKRKAWWDWKPAKQALEILFDTGKLMISERRGFQRVYDLAERVLPDSVDISMPSEEELHRFAIRQSIETQGFGRERDLKWGTDAVQELLKADLIVPILIKDSSDLNYASKTILENVSKKRKKRLHILSPFDNAIISRWRIEEYFDFNCKLECYVPEKKRKYGYFCLSLLWGDVFIGRIDAKADRKTNNLVLKKVLFEKSFKDIESVVSSLSLKLKDFMLFNDCETITLEKVSPAKYKSVLKQKLI